MITAAPTQCTSLYTYISQPTSPTIGLQSAIAAWQGWLDGAIGLFYTPQWAGFGRVTGDQVIWYEWQTGNHQGWQERHLDWDSVFEAKIFTPELELRWFNQPNQGGVAVVLSEQVIDTPPFAPDVGTPDDAALTNLCPYRQTYLLWGEGLGSHTAPAAGWSTLATPRIGRMAVPIANVGRYQSVLLVSREYFGRAPGMAGAQHGNVCVVEERLIQLEVGESNGQ